jgi:hypothetical protein
LQAKFSVSSRLPSNVLEHQRDTLTAVDPDVPTALLGTSDSGEDSNLIAGTNEQVDDVLGHVREGVGQVLIRLLSMDIRSIDEYAPVRADATTDKWP